MSAPPTAKSEFNLSLLSATTHGLRRIPTQRRSRERVERMLEVATACIVKKGLDAVRMSEIAELAEVSIGSLYQFFPDKASIVMTLAEHYNAAGRACVAADLSAVNSETTLRQAMLNIVDGFYDMYLTQPVMQDIWRATQADKSLQKLDAEDGQAHQAMLFDALVRVRPKQDNAMLAARAALVMEFVATTVRLAISMDRQQGDCIIELFKAMLENGLLEE